MRARLPTRASARGALVAGGLALMPVCAWAQNQAAATTLPPVTVTATKPSAEDLPPAYPGGEVGTGARLGILGNIDIMSMPFNATSFTLELIQNRQATTLSDVLMSDPSVRFTTSNGHPYQNFRIRGFDVNQNDIAFNGMFGVLPIGNVPIQFVERVEVLNGPNAMFSGMSPSGAVGGVINLVPKRAGEEPLAQATLGYASSAQGAVSFDVGRRFGDDKSIGVRINGAYTDGETSIDGRHDSQEVLAAALDLRQGGLRVAADLYSTKEKWHGGTPAMFWFATTSIPGAPDPSINQFPAGEGNLDSKGFIVRGEYAFNPSVTAFAAAGVMRHDASGFINGSHVRSINAEGTSTTTLTVSLLGYNDNSAAEGGVRAAFATGPVMHEMVLQASTLDQEAGTASTTSPVFTTNIYRPVYRPLPNAPASVPKSSENTQNSVALLDRMSFLSDMAQLIIGLRWQQVKTDNYNAAGANTGSYDESAVTPAVAAVFKPWGPNVSLYANYVQGLSRGDSVSPPLYAYAYTFKPYKTEQYEAGVKWNAGIVTNTLAVYQITRPMLVMVDGNFPSDDGEKRVRGVEWNVFGELTPQVRLLGGVAYTDGVQTKTANNQYDGKTAVGAPRWQGNLGAEWDLQWVPGLTLTSQVVATSRQYLNVANTQEIPGWGEMDVGARYATLVGGRNLVLRLNVSNVFDKYYYSGAFSDTTPIATMGFGRIVSASASMNF
jgi:iron complex outermembrane receptor protein